MNAFGDFFFFLGGGMIIWRLYIQGWAAFQLLPNRCQLAINSSTAGSQGVRILLGSRYHGFPHIFGRWGRPWCANIFFEKKGDGSWERKDCILLVLLSYSGFIRWHDSWLLLYKTLTIANILHRIAALVKPRFLPTWQVVHMRTPVFILEKMTIDHTSKSKARIHPTYTPKN